MSQPRPDCMALLDLLPPYALEDVKQAYLTKAHSVHPDHGGSTTDFLALQDAYVAAKEYVKYRGDRRHWIATMVERSIRQDQLIEQLRVVGAEISISSSPSLERSLGDFATLMESISVISLVNSKAGNQTVHLIAEHKELLQSLEHLSLTGCLLDDAHVQRLRVLTRLTRLDLSRTAITKDSLGIVRSFPALIELNLRRTRIDWWTRRKVYRAIRRRKLKSDRRDRQIQVFREMIQLRKR
ncbi:MAG: hypothetical protein P8N76_19660 [Pirellulaceae bacterium]|nr:hypothetical protein [Pirellulaceae bacterium]